MKKGRLNLIVLFFALFAASTASAHTGMEHSSILHNAIHIITSISVYLAIMGAGFYFLRKLPKAKLQKVKRDIKK